MLACLPLDQAAAQVQYQAAVNYSLRRTVPTYTGPLVQVRRRCDNATLQIGQTACGDLDTVALKNFVLGVGALNRITPAASVAYSLRRMYCSYAGAAIRVRRSSDNATQDIGFTVAGDLDTAALKTFVGSSNGFVNIWYDQSGNARHLSQAAAANQPQVVTAGKIIRQIGPSAWLTGYAYRRAITITNTFVDANLSDFPLLVAFNADASIGSRLQDITNHTDIRFTASDGATLLKYEKESMTVAGGLATGRYWVKVPTITTAASTTIYLYYGKAGDTDGSDKNNVWDANYNSVWHFSEGTGTTTRDSKNNMTGTLMGGGSAPTWTASGQVARGLSFGGAGYVAISGTPPAGNTPYTLEAWINIDDTGNRRGIVGYGNYGSGNQVNALRSNNEGTGRGFQNYWWGNDLFDNGPYYTAGTWGHVTAKFNGTTRQIFWNANPGASGAPGSPNFGTTAFEIGRTNGGEFWKGILDEVRVSNVARSDAWIKFQYRNMFEAGNCLVFGGEASQQFVGRPTVRFSAAAVQTLKTTGTVTTGSGAFTLFAISSRLNTASEIIGWGDNGGAGRRIGLWCDTGTGNNSIELQGRGKVANSTTTGVLDLKTWIYTSGPISTGLNAFYNGSAVSSSLFSGLDVTPTVVNNEISMGTVPTTTAHPFDGNISEVVGFSSALSTSDRQTIEYLQSDYYAIGGPPAISIPTSDAFVTTWYDQTGGGNHMIQTTDARQPELIANGAVWRVGGRPAIRGNSANQTNLTTIGSSSYSGNLLTANCVILPDEGTNANWRVMSVGNSTLTSNDYNNVSFFNINLRSTNSLVLERTSVSPGTTVTIGSPLVLSVRFNGTNRQLFNNGTGSATQADAGNFNFQSLRLLQSINPGFEPTEALTGRMAEFTWHLAALNTTRRTLIENNQAAYYRLSISNSKYTPPSPTSYVHDVNGIGRESATDSVTTTRQTTGMGFRVGTTAGDFLKDNGDYLMCGMNCPITAGTSTANLPPTVLQRWTNDWYIQKTDVGSNHGNVTVYFDFGDYGVSGVPGTASSYVLLSRSSPTGTFAIASGTTVTVVGDQVRFALDASNLTTNQYYTIGTNNPASSPLPIELVSFSGTCNQGLVSLNWSTASEINNDFFTVYRSTDGSEWNDLATVKGAGTTRQARHYTYRDEQPRSGRNYYRLKQTDFDGRYTFSPVIAAGCDEKNSQEILVYPNPASDEITIELQGINEKRDLQVIDLSGRVLFRGTMNSRQKVSIAHLPAGTYLIRISTSNTITPVLFTKFVKQ